jgi:hypothetical protein
MAQVRLAPQTPRHTVSRTGAIRIVIVEDEPDTAAYGRKGCMARVPRLRDFRLVLRRAGRSSAEWLAGLLAMAASLKLIERRVET